MQTPCSHNINRVIFAIILTTDPIVEKITRVFSTTHLFTPGSDRYLPFPAQSHPLYNPFFVLTWAYNPH